MKPLVVKLLAILIIVAHLPHQAAAQVPRTPCVCKDAESQKEVYGGEGLYGSCRLDDNDECVVSCKAVPANALILAAEVLATITEEEPDLTRMREQRRDAVPILRKLLAGKTREGSYNITYDADDIGFCFPESAVNLLKQAIDELEAMDKSTSRSVACTDMPTRRESFVDNGLVVGQTKLFDERSLRSMLETAEESLRRVSAVDPAKLAQATGALQGERVRETALGVSAKTLPGVILGSDNDPPPSPTVAPSGTTAPGLTSAIPFQPTFGISSQDLLAEQMSLNYQIINLRMLLERSISDRLYIEKEADGSTFFPDTRAQAIVGFQISIDPRPEYRNAVAEVDISLTSDCHRAQSASLVSLLPRDKTYNVATVSKDAKSFGLGAVVQFIDLGVSASGKRETLYLVRDTDTVALERRGFRPAGAAQPVEQAKTLTFGWQFRPVLGRKAVEPGTRQVYAMLALPTDNRFATPYEAYVEVRTRWRRYDSKTNTVGEPIKGSESYHRLSDLEVRSGGFHEHILGPRVDSVTWDAIGNGLVMVKVRGSNFLTGTTVVVGDTVLDRPETGLFRQGENYMMFKVPSEKLAQPSPPVIISRYGPAIELRNAILARSSEHVHGIERVGDPSVTAADAQNSTVTVTVREKKFLQGLQEERNTPMFVYKPIAMVGGRAFGLGDNSLTKERVDGPTQIGGNADVGTFVETFKLTFTAPNSLLREAGAVKIVDLFYGERFAISVPIIVSADDFTATELLLLSSSDSLTSYAVRGTKFNKTKVIRLIVGGETFCLAPSGAGTGACTGAQPLQYIDSTLVSFNTKPEVFKGVKNILVAQGDAHAVVPLPTPPPVPTPVIEKADDISEGDIKTITLRGTDLGSIETIKFEGDSLKIKVAPNGKSMTLAASSSSSLTAKAGDKELHLHLKNGTVVTYVLNVKKRG